MGVTNDNEIDVQHQKDWLEEGLVGRRIVRDSDMPSATNALGYLHNRVLQQEGEATHVQVAMGIILPASCCYGLKDALCWS